MTFIFLRVASPTGTRANNSLRPVDFAADGIFLCGLAHSPRSLDDRGVLDVLREGCGPERWLIFARAVSTPQEHLQCVPLGEARPAMADMRTLVIVGSSTTRRVGRFVYTPRSAP